MILSLRLKNKDMKYIIEAKAEATVWEHRYYEIEANSEKDAIKRCIEDGILVDSIESDYNTNELVLTKISYGDVSKNINVQRINQ